MYKDEYAQALMLALKGVEGEEASKRVGRFIALLRREGHIRLLPKILATYESISEVNARKEGLIVSVAKESDIHTYSSDIKKTAAEIGVTDGTVTTRTDETLIGGYKVQARDKIIDRSFKQALLTIYHRSITN